MPSVCVPHHDWFTAFLTFGLCCGLVVSYLPQHIRIINQGSSEGFSPWFLLLGSASSAAGFFNMITMQWHIVKCCPAFSLGTCLEMTAGVVQLGLQWALFTIVFILYMIYYPPHLKYIQLAADTHDTRSPLYVKALTPVKSSEWHLSIILSCVAAIHMTFITITSFFLLLTVPTSPAPDTPLPGILAKWATFLGVSSALLAAIQYTPQLIHTYRAKIVGALSIPMMCMQSPGAILMMLSIALRPGTNWTSWVTFAVSGIMQGSLLTMCIVFHFRQRRLGLDEFGNPSLSRAVTTHAPASEETDFERSDGDVDVPGLVTSEEEDSRAVRVALVRALDSATGTDIRANAEEVPTEDTPLLRKEENGWLSCFRRA